jgi:hypothetical protein
MTTIVPDVDQPGPKKTAFAECPRCSQRVEGFQIDEVAIDDAVITLRPCGCVSHSSDGHYKLFVDVVKGAGL